MQLDENQKKIVANWIEEGLSLSDIQARLEAEMDIHTTYMDVRLLVGDLELVPNDEEESELVPADTPAPEPVPRAGRPHGRYGNLMRCPDCGKDVSDNAAACPNCGCLLQRKVDQEAERQAAKEEDDNEAMMGCFFLCVIAIGIVVWLAKGCN